LQSRNCNHELNNLCSSPLIRRCVRCDHDNLARRGISRGTKTAALRASPFAPPSQASFRCPAVVSQFPRRHSDAPRLLPRRHSDAPRFPNSQASFRRPALSPAGRGISRATITARARSFPPPEARLCSDVEYALEAPGQLPPAPEKPLQKTARMKNPNGSSDYSAKSRILSLPDEHRQAANDRRPACSHLPKIEFVASTLAWI
jgi:hypothetical protein